MIIETFTSGPLDTNAYLIMDKETSSAILIDAPLNSYEKITSYIKKNKVELKGLFLTHSHFDHIADASKFIKQDPHLTLWVHKEDADNVKVPGSDGIPLFFHIEGVKSYSILDEGSDLKFGELNFYVIHTPGHSPGSVCFYFPDQHLLFSGDTLFKASIGTLSLPTSEPDRMWQSLKKLEVLPKATKVYPGHGPLTTIGNETWLKNPKDYLG